ncbi:MAG TPA: Uma2 family endonuclease [Byssovorax sp.]|jgi:Uma2 family endonuclease
MGAAEKLTTNGDLRSRLDALPDDVTGEVIDGQLYTMGRARPAHQRAVMRACTALDTGGYGGAPPPEGWVILLDVEILFETLESAVPDVSGWRTERIAGHEHENPIRVVPDWVCEVLSDSTKAKDLGPKRELYARQGVSHLWIVDADARTVEVFALNADARWVLLGTWSGDATMSAAPFDSTPIALSGWWLAPSG